MRMTPSKLLNIVLVTVLALSFFSIYTAVNTSSYETTDASPEYNPWRDLNDDGIINIYDVVMVTGIYLSTGTPINKTALLYEVNNTFTELLSRIDGLETQIAELETKLAVLNATKLGKPDYDTIEEYGDWIYLPKGDTTIYHYLNTTNVIVYIAGKVTLGGAIHQMVYGGDQSSGYWDGAFWHQLTTTGITVHRHGDDTHWVYVRVMIWKIPE